MSLQTALDEVEALDPSEQNQLIDIILKRRIEARREEIKENAIIALSSYNNGKSKVGDLDSLLMELENL